MERTKVTRMMKHGLGDKFSSSLFEILSQSGNFFSIIMDETTDRGTKKQCAFTVIYMCPEKEEIKTRFFDLVETRENQELQNCTNVC